MCDPFTAIDTFKWRFFAWLIFDLTTAVLYDDNKANVPRNWYNKTHSHAESSDLFFWLNY